MAGTVGQTCRAKVPDRKAGQERGNDITATWGRSLCPQDAAFLIQFCVKIGSNSDHILPATTGCLCISSNTEGSGSLQHQPVVSFKEV